MNFKNHKPTFLSILSMVGIILGIPFGIYCLSLTGGASLGGVFVFGFAIVLAIILAIDRVLITLIDQKKLSIIEFILTLLLISIYYMYQD